MNEQRSRLRHPKYKTSLCKDYPLGKCTFGNRCNFAHSLDELRAALPAGTALGQQQQQLQQQQQIMIQAPVKVLPDGRMMSTFTPVSAESDDARGLRRYQSMGTLRALPGAAVAPPAPPIPETMYTAVCDNAPSASDNVPSAFASPTQPLLHLHADQGNVARRVASLSQLPTLRSSALAPVGAPYLQGLGVTNAYVPTSPLVHHSPVISSPSPAEPELATPQPQPVSDSTLVGDWPHYQPQHLQPAVQKRTLTSSISMQTLPRFNVPVAWDAPPPVGSLSSSQHLHTISAQSSATLIDSDVWASSAYSPMLDSPAAKPLESRFFPASADAQPAVPHALPRMYPSPYTSHRQLRRQQSTDDWVLLRNSHNPAPKSIWEPSMPPAAKPLYR
ncbi:hypothetical protein H4S01_006727 [Coemansia sp. RSA 2610]|nr:hypothetical protein H4S01_006727 [Coemansia sp. RSA 2610]